MRTSRLSVGSILFTVLLAGVNAPAQGAVLDRLEASVNASIILLSDVAHFKKTARLRAQLDPLFSGTPVATKGDAATRPEVVDFLIDERLITQQYPVTDSEVEQSINSIQANNRIDRASLKKALSEQGFTFDDYFELIRISASKRNLIDRDIRTKVTISEDDIKNYFYNHYAKGAATNRAYQLKIITVSGKSYKTTAAARDIATKALKDLRSGESFEEVAKRVSDDSAAATGGDLGTLTEDQMSPAIREQVKKLRIGQVSEVFGNPEAGVFYILKLIDVRSDESSRLDKVREEIQAHLAAAEYQRQIQLWLERQRQTAFIHKVGEPASK